MKTKLKSVPQPAFHEVGTKLRLPDIIWLAIKDYYGNKVLTLKRIEYID